MLRQWRKAFGYLGTAALLAPAGAASQQLRGTVVDSVSRFPVAGAVVSLIDARDSVIARTLSGNGGAYTLPLPARALRTHVVRIGFRPRDLPIVRGPDGNATVDIAMAMLPTLLVRAEVAVKQCPRRSDAEQAAGLWEQARAELLSVVVARESNPGSLKAVSYTRWMRGTSDEIDHQRIMLDSVARSPNAYHAVRSATDFVDGGFTTSDDGNWVFYAPDADVLLDPAFTNGYCFRLVDVPRDRAGQVGLGFRAPDRRKGRVDIDATLWVDTVARAIVEIEYRYVGIEERTDALNPGGHISIRRMPNGVEFVNEWAIRMIGANEDTVEVMRSMGGAGTRLATQHFYAAVSGGEVAYDRWTGRLEYRAHLGELELSVLTADGVPAQGARVALVDTPYEAKLGPDGLFAVTDLVPGPYTLVVRDSRLAPIQLDSIPTSYAFTAARDTVVTGATKVLTLEQWVTQRCADEHRLDPLDGRARKPDSRTGSTGRTLLLARVIDSTGSPIGGVRFTINRLVSGPGEPPRWDLLREGGITGGNGLLQICTEKLSVDDQVAISLRKDRRTPRVYVLKLSGEELTVVPLVLSRQ